MFVLSWAPQVVPKSYQPFLKQDKNIKLRKINYKLEKLLKQIAIKALWMGVDLKTAIDSPRVHHQLFPHKAEIESDFSQVL
jgi:hypothetical protein